MATSPAQPDSPLNSGKLTAKRRFGNPVSRFMASRGIYYGWIMTAVAFVCSLWSIGFIFYTYGLFREPIRQDMGWSVSTMTNAYATYTLAMALWGPLSSRMTERFGPRVVVTFGAAVLPVALFSLSCAHTKWQFFVGFGVFASFGTSMLGTIPTFAALNHWFTTNKAQSFSWASAGLSSAGLVLVPLTQYLIGRYGWRTAYQINAVLLVLTIYPLIAFLFYNRPEDLGVPEEEPPAPDLEAAPDRLLEYREIVLDMRFILTVASLALASACWSVILQSFVSDLSTRSTGFKWEPTAAASLFAFLAMLCGIGKPIFGAVGDRMERRRAIIMAVTMQLVGFLFMIATRWYEFLPFQVGGIHTDLLLTAGILLYGLGVGGCLPLFSALHADQFGRLSFPRVSGIATPFNVAVVFCMYLLTGSLYDRYQSYLPQSWIFIGGYLVSLLCIVILMIQVKRPRNPRKTFDTPLEQAEPV